MQIQKEEKVVVDYSAMTIAELAVAIHNNWEKLPRRGLSNHPAGAYLEPMMSLEKISDTYGWDSGDMIVRYFLSNATAWRGDVAKAIKAELKRRLK